MVEITELTAQHMLRLPDGIAEHFRPADRFVIWLEGDTLHLKRITPAPVTNIVAQAPEGEPIPLQEINELVHKVRRQRDGRSRR